MAYSFSLTRWLFLLLVILWCQCKPSVVLGVRNQLSAAAAEKFVRSCFAVQSISDKLSMLSSLGLNSFLKQVLPRALDIAPLDPPSTINRNAFENFRYNWLKDLLRTMERGGNEERYPFPSIDSQSQYIRFIIRRLATVPSYRFTYGTIYETLLILESALKSQNWVSSVFDVYDILPDGREELVARGGVFAQNHTV